MFALLELGVDRRERLVGLVPASRMRERLVELRDAVVDQLELDVGTERQVAPIHVATPALHSRRNLAPGRPRSRPTPRLVVLARRERFAGPHRVQVFRPFLFHERVRDDGVVFLANERSAGERVGARAHIVGQSQYPP